MIRRPPSSTRTDTLLPYTTLFRSSWPLFYAGLKIAERDAIGTDATLRGTTAEGLRAFYERWYRPDRTTVIMVGDADPKLMERSEEHTSELQSLMRTSYAVFCLKKKKQQPYQHRHNKTKQYTQ